MENVPTEPQARIDLVWKGGLRGAATPAVSVPVRPALLGIGFLFAFLMGAVGLAGIQREPDLAPFVDALCWGALGVCLLEAAGSLIRHSRKISGARDRWPGACALLGIATLPLLWGEAPAAPWASALGVVAGGAWCALAIEWFRCCALQKPWGLVLHGSLALCAAGILYVLGPLGRVGTAAWSLSLTVFALGGAALLVVAARGSGPHESQVGEQPDRRHAVAGFFKTQWLPLAGMALLAFVHGLRWHSAVVGQVMEKPYAMGGLEYILGPCLTLACAWAVLLRRPGASPQRTSCQFLIPIAAAILLVVPVLNPLRGFYATVDPANPLCVALEIALDVLNEGAVALLFLSALVSVMAAPRTAGVSSRFAASMLVGCTVTGMLLGTYGFLAVGLNGSIVCFLAWTVYLLAAGFASIGKDRGDREGQRLSQESVENFIRRASRRIAQRYGLSQREEEILRYLARGYSYTYTAQDFCISENTVRTHAKHIYAKLGIAKREQLFRLLDAEYGDAGGEGEKTD